MSETIAFENVYMSYIENAAYQYPSIDIEHTVQTQNYGDLEINTGWHIIPNFLWRHCMIPRQWDALVRNCEAYQVKAIKCTVYNPIPITTNISLQRTSLFSAFNNCTYALTYTDDLYETDWYPWLTIPKESQLYLSQREGLIWSGTQPSVGQDTQYTAKRYQWPIYQWRKPNMRTIWPDVWSQGKNGQAGVHDVHIDSDGTGKLVVPSGVFWDPFNRPDEIGELRAGKNSISYNWNVHESDKGKWFNLDLIAAYTIWSADGPYCGVGRPGTLKDTISMDPQLSATYGLAYKKATDAGNSNDSAIDFNDYTIPNYANQPLVPTKWFWKELQESVGEWLPGQQDTTYGSNVPWWWKMNKCWPGTEREACLYPPHQWFIKGIPLYDVSNTHIRTSTQVSTKITLILEGRKRRSAYYCPTYGPTSGQQLYYQANDKMIFQPAAIRYKTGGMRRTWQNLCPEYRYAGTDGTLNSSRNATNLKKHPRVESFRYQTNITETDFTRTCRYNQGHRITGMKDATNANSLSPFSARKDAQPMIRVRWTRDTDETEIIMEDPDEEAESSV